MSARAARNSGYEYRSQVDARGDGMPLVQWLASRYRHSDTPTWRARVAEGRVCVDGAVAAEDAILRKGQAVVWSRPPWTEPAAPIAFETLYRDPDLLAVIKPAGLPTLPGGGFLEHTLLARVRAGDPGAAPLHRLGRFTSGIVLFARTRTAHAAVSRAWREGRVEKRYRTLAAGQAPSALFRVDVPIGPVPHPRLGTVHAASATGKAAESVVRVVAQYEDGFLADVTIPTGRPHQIRIHLAASGHPLVGDPLYGPDGRPATAALPGDPGYRLHATALNLTHPTSGQRLELRHPPPSDLDVVGRCGVDGLS